jgi:hypothetical protein
MGIVTALVAAVVLLVGLPGGRMHELAERRAAAEGDEGGEAVPEGVPSISL